MKPIDHDLARRGLAAFTDCLNVNFRGRFFVIDGTLLGLVRQGGFIDGDYDIDFGMWIDDFDNRLIGDLEQAGFALKHRFGSPDNGMALHFRYHEITFDILFFYRTQTAGNRPGVWAAVYDKRRQLRGSYPDFTLQPAVFQGIDVMIPSPPEDYLETVYGAKWRIPVKAWNYRFAPKNLRAHGDLRWRLNYTARKWLWRWRNRDIHVRAGTPAARPVNADE